MACRTPPSPDDAQPGRVSGTSVGCRPPTCSARRPATLRKVVRDQDFIAFRASFANGFYAVGSDPNHEITENLPLSHTFTDAGSFYGVHKKRHHDALILGSTTFAEGFMNPRRQRARDTVQVTMTFPSGAHTPGIQLSDPITESILQNLTFVSGSYLPTVVTETFEDSSTVALTFISGLYELKVSESDPVGDDLLLELQTEPGDYTLTIEGPYTETESLLLTNTFDSGIYG